MSGCGKNQGKLRPVDFRKGSAGVTDEGKYEGGIYGGNHAGEKSKMGVEKESGNVWQQGKGNKDGRPQGKN